MTGQGSSKPLFEKVPAFCLIMWGGGLSLGLTSITFSPSIRKTVSSALVEAHPGVVVARNPPVGKVMVAKIPECYKSPLNPVITVLN